ncbi:Type I restriction-modification system methyltransferase subunit [Anaerohalosphaera lusitana]|uniref:Type I restriction-modification system methyltransferase subunit n=1 Tax=Anaerohalosphaera lusitana TaxID=1936003 RepID=A0A1U9NQ61_9BACT|nr:hypothetical protein [Anaerohalosphaera lusitana]AQT70072.1 Type I restriction-modification system methyltransferase subunit [Anaerohalosphaera lusitana]
MAIPYTIKNNNYNKNTKDSTIYTPERVSVYLFNLLQHHINPCVLLDPAIGKGSLTNIWRSRTCKIIGVDISRVGSDHCDTFIHGKFENIHAWSYESPDLILCNPPFNGAKGKKLYSEVFLRKMVDLFGPKVPIAMFAPMGMRLNVRAESKRWEWMRDTLDITSIVSLPIDCFGLKFHTEILIFNVPTLKPHYFLYEQSSCSTEG